MLSCLQTFTNNAQLIMFSDIWYRILANVNFLNGLRITWSVVEIYHPILSDVCTIQRRQD